MTKPNKHAQKDAYYFPHFSNARHDRKVKRVIKELGVEGYGIYFMLLEVLREQTTLCYPMSDIDLLADEFGTSEQKVRTVICNYCLFDVTKDEMFFSPKQIEYLQPYFEKSQRARNAALIRWNSQPQLTEGKDVNANAKQMQCSGNASKVKYSKVKYSKEEENIVESIYDKYPSKCKISKRSLGKGVKDKKKIATLLKSHTKEDLLARIEYYTKECVKSDTYMKNFSTFLNNLPDIEKDDDSREHQIPPEMQNIPRLDR